MLSLPDPLLHSSYLHLLHYRYCAATSRPSVLLLLDARLFKEETHIIYCLGSQSGWISAVAFVSHQHEIGKACRQLPSVADDHLILCPARPSYSTCINACISLLTRAVDGGLILHNPQGINNKHNHSQWISICPQFEVSPYPNELHTQAVGNS